MNKKLTNPYQKDPEYNCFGCSQKHPFGLKLKFEEEGDYIISKWQPSLLYQGWNGVLHGGIQATLLDEIASWVVSAKIGKAGVTADMHIKLKHAVLITEKPLLLKAKIKDLNRNLALIEAELYDSENKLCVISEFKYFVFNDEVSKEKFNFPGKDAFFE